MILRWIGNIFFAFVIGTLGVYLTWALIVGELPVAGPAAILFFSALLAMLAWASGLTRLYSASSRDHASLVLTYVEQAVRLNLPLPRMLQAAEASEQGALSHQLHQVLARLEMGDSITSSLKNAGPGTPARTLAMLGAAEQIGQIGPELHRQVRAAQQRPRQNISERSFVASYPFGMTIVIVFVVSIMVTFVVPKYLRILRDFNTQLPAPTRALIQIVNVLGENGWLELAILLTAALAVIHRVIRRVRLGRFPDSSRVWFTSSRQYSDVCHVIAQSLQAGQPLDSAIRLASELAISASFRNRLNRWAMGIEQGRPTAQAGTAAGIPQLIIGLTSTPTAASAAEAFTFLSRYYAAKFSRTMTILRASAVPGMVFFFGIIVAFVALALFMPMIALLDSLSGVKGSL